MQTPDAVQTTSRRSSEKSVDQVVLSAILLAMAVVLALISKYIPFLHFSNGGSISLAMVPLTLAALILGPVWGTFVGLAFGVLDMLLDGGYAFVWLSLVLDYFLAFAVVGFSSLFRKAFFEKKAWSLIAAFSLFWVLRFVCHFFSGCVVMWTTDTGEIAPDFSGGAVLYSLGYNAGYLVPTFVLCVVLLMALADPIFRVLDNARFKALAPKDVRAESVKPSHWSVLDSSFLLLDGTLVLAGILSVVPFFYSALDETTHGDVLGHVLPALLLVASLAFFVLVLVLFGSRPASFEADEKTMAKAFRGKTHALEGTLLLVSLIPLVLSVTSLLLFHFHVGF